METKNQSNQLKTKKTHYLNLHYIYNKGKDPRPIKD